MASPSAGGGATSGSYYEEYMRSNALRKHGSDRSAKQLLTDRNAYISFLEVQLERVSAACLSAQTVERRLAELEAAQIANDQKLSSLSKVFRLNQEYMEQTADQARAELTAFASKVDSWMDKYATDVAAHETRLMQCEEQLRRCDDVLTSVRDETHRELSDTTQSVQRDVEELRTMLFAAETRLENMQLEQHDAKTHIESLQEVLNERLETDMERFRATLSEKAMGMDQIHDQLIAQVREAVTEVEATWQVEMERARQSHRDDVDRLTQRVETLHHEACDDVNDVRALLRKCLDAQHLLSATVVSLERDVDVAAVGGSRQRAATVRPEVVEELQENQARLRDALRAVQSCARDAAERSDVQCERLADRLEAAEEQFTRLAHDAVERADVLRTKMLEALSDVESQLRFDADTTADRAVQLVRTELDGVIAQVSSMTSRTEARVDMLMDDVASLQERVRRIESNALPESREGAASRGNLDVGELTAAVTRSVQEHLRSTLSRRVVPGHSDDESPRLSTTMLGDASTKTTRKSLQRDVAVSSSSISSSVSSRSSRGRVVAGTATKPPTARVPASSGRVPRSKAVESHRKTRTPTLTTAKTKRLKEICSELVALESSIKSQAAAESHRRIR